MEEHEVIVEQDSSGGYTCTGCGDPAVLLIGAGKWIHESDNVLDNVLKVGTSARVEVKDFKPRSPQGYTEPNFIDVDTLYKNRREALYASVAAQTLDSSDQDLFELAERMEEWLNRTLGQYSYIREVVEEPDSGPTPLHVIEDEVQNLP